MKEKISTLLDDELDLKNSASAVSEMMQDKKMRSRFETYQLIRDIMKNELNDSNFSSKAILDAIDKEPIQIQFMKEKKLSHVMAITHLGWLSWPVAASFVAVFFIAAITMNHSFVKPIDSVEIAEEIPADYIKAHQMLAPTNVAYYTETDGR